MKEVGEAEVKIERIEAVGTVVRDPELRRVGTDSKLVAEVTIAADKLTVDGQAVQPTQETKWQKAVFWGLDAKRCVDQVRKGATVRLEGKKVAREYTKDGELRTSHEIHRPRDGKLSLEVISQGREQHPGNPIEVKGIVKYDPELKMSPGGKLYTRITVDASEVKIDGQEVDPKANQKQTAVFWEKAAENVADAIKRGMPVAIKGELVTREYEDRGRNLKTGSEIHKAQLEQLELGKKNGAARGKAREAELDR